VRRLLSDRRKFITIQLSNRQTTVRLQFPVKNWTDAHEEAAQIHGLAYFKALMAAESGRPPPRGGDARMSGWRWAGASAADVLAEAFQRALNYTVAPRTDPLRRQGAERVMTEIASIYESVTEGGDIYDKLAERASLPRDEKAAAE
jgi:hypothetical protein